jgi:hypothetical protein
MLRRLWRLALESNDYRAAASVAQRMAKLVVSLELCS